MPKPSLESFTNVLPPRYSDWIKFYCDVKHVISESEQIVYQDRGIDVIKEYTVSKAFLLQSALECIVLELSKINSIVDYSTDHSETLYMFDTFFRRYENLFKP